MLVVQVLREFAVEDFFSYKSRKRRIFFSDELLTRSRTWKPLNSARAGLSPKIKGTSERRNQDDQGSGLSPQEGDVRRFKKRKRPEGEKVAPRRKISVSSTKKFLFLVNEYLGSERPISFEYRLLRDFVYEEAMCEGSSGNGLPYAARAVP